MAKRGQDAVGYMHRRGSIPMKAAALALAFLAGTVMAGQLLGRSMANMVDDARMQQCSAGVVTKCD